MTMDRREILKGGAALTALAIMPVSLRAAPMAGFAPKPGAWRTFDVTTRLELPAGSPASAWVPLPSLGDDEWIRPITSGWSTNAATATVREIGASKVKMLHVQWPWNGSSPMVEVRSRVATRDRSVDFGGGRGKPELDAEEIRRYTAGTRFVPVDGPVKEISDRITGGTTDDIEKVRRIYEWVVANTFRDPATRGCGAGDIGAMLSSGRLGGKCADLNTLFVGLVRASGIPARELYGIRVAPTAFGYKSLGADGANLTEAQHCRAEVYLSGFGWVAMDPADVRKVILEEPGNLTLSDAAVDAVRRALFGTWEGNWIAYNDARDVALPGASGASVPFLMYPQAEVSGVRLDCLDPSAFKYRITSREVAA